MEIQNNTGGITINAIYLNNKCKDTIYYLEKRKIRLIKKFSCIQFLKIHLKHKNSEKLEVQDKKWYTQ